jgi:hypothetical protein
MVEPTAPAPAEHPGVRFEREDIEPRPVVYFAVALIVGLIVVALILWGLFAFFEDREKARNKEAALPPAAVDENREPPEPRLEQFDDVRKREVSLWPPRARQSLSPEARRLKEGDPAREAIPIDKAIADLSTDGPHALPVLPPKKGGR